MYKYSGRMQFNCRVILSRAGKLAKFMDLFQIMEGECYFFSQNIRYPFCKLPGAAELAQSVEK